MFEPENGLCEAFPTELKSNSNRILCKTDLQQRGPELSAEEPTVMAQAFRLSFALIMARSKTYVADFAVGVELFY